jgi:hypothetical protein
VTNGRCCWKSIIEGFFTSVRSRLYGAAFSRLYLYGPLTPTSSVNFALLLFYYLKFICVIFFFNDVVQAILYIGIVLLASLLRNVVC